MRRGNYIKVIGLRFDQLEGIEIVTDFNRKDFKEASEQMEKYNDGNTLFVGVPCTYKCVE